MVQLCHHSKYKRLRPLRNIIFLPQPHKEFNNNNTMNNFNNKLSAFVSSWHKLKKPFGVNSRFWFLCVMQDNQWTEQKQITFNDQQCAQAITGNNLMRP